MISLNILGETIYPKRGILQGSSWAPYLFCLYVNNILEKFQTSEINLQAYMDEIVIQGSDTQSIQGAFNIVFEELNDIGLEINGEKCEFIAELDEFNTNPMTGRKL